MPNFELDPREVDAFVFGMPPRQELIYRLAIRHLSERCRRDRQFKQRTEALIERFQKQLPSVLKDAKRLRAELEASAG